MTERVKMSAITIELRRAIELTGGTVEIVPMEYAGAEYGRISKLTGGQVGLEELPIFDTDYRDILTGKIVDKFYHREIGFETISMFSMKMRTKLNEIMPFYNQLYKSTLIEYEALSTINLKTESKSTNTGTEDTTGTTTATGKTNSGSRAVNSTTPQTMLAGSEDYASAASDSTSLAESESENESTAVSTSTGQAEGDTLVSGYQGTPADLIMRFRDSLLNVDLMVLRDLEELFMQVFDTGDSYTPYRLGYLF